MNAKYFFITIILLFISCNSANEQKTLKVATAANLRFAMDDINLAFEQKSGIKVEMIAASSGKLTAQIKNGAPYDVFLSANYKYPNTLFQEGLTIERPLLFCNGVLVIWTNNDIPIDSSLSVINEPIVQKIAIANPQNAPYGFAAKEVLQNLQMYDEVKSKLIFAENVSQLNQYVLNKATDAGITSKSSVLAAQLKNTGHWKELNHELYSPIRQFVVELKSKETQSDNAKKYIRYLLSKKSQNILNTYGYKTNWL